jgi:hypothetical protein
LQATLLADDMGRACLLQVFETNTTLHVVTERCSGGELFAQIAAKKHYGESDAADLIRVRA